MTDRRATRVTLDPIVSLSVALAEAPRTCAFLLGSGVSRDAGVPTGFQVMRAGLHRLHQLETSSGDQIDEDALDTWLLETGRTGLTYSDLLALIAPDMAVRRDYLASLFEGVKPGATHEALADLAARDMVRVFITTNFDRLLEHALQARGIEPMVIASDADLAATVPREHATAVVIKPHGDYQQQTIRNTPDELSELEPRMTSELSEVFDRYGIVALGYSGSDEALGRIARGRRSRYGLWWVARGELGRPAAELVEATAGRTIIRPSAAEFLSDLRSRLAVFETHPSGYTPAVVHDETLALVRASDGVGLDEKLRHEAHWWQREIANVVSSASKQRPDDKDKVGEIWGHLAPVLERRLATLLPLALYDAERFSKEVQSLARALERRPLIGGFQAWIDLPEYAATWLGYVLGALLIRLERYEALSPLLQQTWTNRYDTTEPLIWLPGEAGNTFGLALAPEGNWLSPAWEHITRSLSAFIWLQERYPELSVDPEPRRSMAQFDLLICLHLGLIEHRALAYFSLANGAAEELALRLHSDVRLRERVAGVLGVSLEELDSKGAATLRETSGFQGGFSNHRRVAAILAEGRGAS
jgi:hypothetical protein